MQEMRVARSLAAEVAQLNVLLLAAVFFVGVSVGMATYYLYGERLIELLRQQK